MMLPKQRDWRGLRMCHETVQIEAMETRKHMSDNTRLFPTFFFLPPLLFIPTENEAPNSAPRFPFSAFPVSSISSFFSFTFQWRWLSSPLSCSWLSLRFPCFKPLWDLLLRCLTTLMLTPFPFVLTELNSLCFCLCFDLFL